MGYCASALGCFGLWGFSVGAGAGAGGGRRAILCYEPRPRVIATTNELLQSYCERAQVIAHELLRSYQYLQYLWTAVHCNYSTFELLQGSLSYCKVFIHALSYCFCARPSSSLLPHGALAGSLNHGQPCPRRARVERRYWSWAIHMPCSVPLLLRTH